MLKIKRASSVLIATDKATDGYLFTEIAKIKGQTAICLESCSGLSKALEEDKNSINTLVVDLDMPCIKNSSILEDLKDIKKRLKIIAFTCINRAELKMSEHNPVIDYIFVKPVHIYKFAEILERVVSDKSLENPLVII